MKLKTFSTSIACHSLLILAASACDFCACERPSMSLDAHTGWNIRISEQFTHSGTLRMDGRTIANPNEEHLDSSITQIIIGYDFSKSLGVQFSVPLISRDYRRWHHGALDSGNVSGLGDVTLLAYWAPLQIERTDFKASARLFAGLSLPTGNSDRIAEEGDEEHKNSGEHDESQGEDAEEVASGVHGHDLALGTGGVGGIFGLDAHIQWKRWFASAGVEGVIRAEGADHYQFANEVSWHTSLGGYLLEGDGFNLGLAIECSGASKGEDTFNGIRATDTASSVVWLGPQLSASWAKRYQAEVGVDFPVARSNSGTQTAPDWRVTASFGVRF